MQAVRPTDKRAYLHFASRFPFPLNPIFFGQTFVIGNLTTATEFSQAPTRNLVFVKRSETNGVKFEGLMGLRAERLAKERFKAELKIGYTIDALEETVKTIRDLLDNGFYPVLAFHFPVSPDTEFAYRLRKRLEELGIDKDVAILFYLHTTADNLYHKLHTPEFDAYYRFMTSAADAVIGVSSAVCDSFIHVPSNDGRDGVVLTPDNAFTVRNGIDPNLYTIDEKDEIEDMKRQIGLNKDVEVVVSFAGRLDRLKGSDYLVQVLQHYNESTNPRDGKVGFVIATPHVLDVNHSSKSFKAIMGMDRLIREGRLKLVLDISKFTRADQRFRADVEELFTTFARANGLEQLEGTPVYGGMINRPVQAMSDIYLHPARSEAFGLAVLEGVFGGAFVIATKVGGIPEIIVDPRLGILVDIDTNINTFVNRLIMELRGSCELSDRRTFDREELSAYFGSYSSRAMFNGFDAAVSKIIERKRG